MDYNLSILLYSNYSPRSQQLLEALKICPIDLANMARMSSICIDNEQIRNRITKSKNITIDTVPTILLAYNNGTIEKYSGEQAFEWIEQTVQHHLPPPPPPPQPQPEPEPEPISIQKSKTSKHVQINDKMTTNMEDLDDDDDGDDLKKPPIMMRNGPGGFDVTNDVGIEHSVNIIPEKTTQKPVNLMEQAMAMQKERGGDDD